MLLLDEVLRGRLDPTVYLYSHYIYTVVFLCPESCNSTLHVHVTRYTIHDTRYTIHDTRYTYTRHTLDFLVALQKFFVNCKTASGSFLHLARERS